jgi:protein TonB
LLPQHRQHLRYQLIENQTYIMKIITNVLFLSAALFIAQACSPKAGENDKELAKAEEAAETEASRIKKVSSTEMDKKQKREKLEQATREQAEKRRLQREELALKTPTFKTDKGEIIYNKAEVDPTFIGGDAAMMTYLRDNVKYPKEAEENGIEGTVFVDFVVGENGKVRMVEIADATSDEVGQVFRDEAYRVVNAMPKWSAGRQHNKPVSVRFSIPITFQTI